MRGDRSEATKSLLALAVMALVSSLVGCRRLAMSRDQHDLMALPARFAHPEGEEAPSRWWEAFGAPELNCLVEEGLEGNLTVKQSWARLRGAEAIAQAAGSRHRPDLSLEAGAARSRQNPVVGSRFSTKDLTLGLSGSYEVDLWGRVAAGREAADLDAIAARCDAEAALLTLAGQISDTWILLTVERRQRQLLQEQLETNTTYLQLLEWRFSKSLANALDVFQQRQSVAQVRSELPLSVSREKVLLNELTVLTGRAPMDSVMCSASTPPTIPPLPSLGLPADLLSARPDIRAAFVRLCALDRRVEEARADRLPAIRLSAAASFRSDTVSSLLRNWYTNLAAGLTQPVFDGGRRKAEVERSSAVAEEQLHAYRETVLRAFEDVGNALAREEQQRLHLEALDTEIRAATNTNEEARRRYLKGLNDYLPVLTSLQRIQSLERTRVRQYGEMVRFRIGLYRALGSSWAEKALPPTPSQEGDRAGRAEDTGGD